MSNEFRICDKCKATNVESLTKKLKEIDPLNITPIDAMNILYELKKELK